MLDCVVEVGDGSISLNQEHDKSAWLNPGAARKLYEKDSAKKMVSVLEKYLSTDIVSPTPRLG